jgi:large subunit ribosomal protein L15
MPLSLHTIKPAIGAKKTAKRVGRGNASGHGTYSTRGLKGQKSRSGSSGLKRLGMKKILLATPKSRGFKSLKPKNQVVSFSALSERFKDGSLIDPKSLVRAGLVPSANVPVKILSVGKLSLKSLKFSGIKASESAIETIKKMGGEIR